MAQAPLDLKDRIYMKTRDGEEIEFSVIALLEDQESKNAYAVLRSADAGEESFIVTDPYGELIEDDELAQQVLDDFLLFNEDQQEGDK
jgi:hypothetical protein